MKTAAIADIEKLIIKRKKSIIKSPAQTEKELIVIGSSTGGPQAVFNIITELPRKKIRNP